MTTLGLDRLPGRCSLGFAAIHHPTFCACAEMGEWSIFVAALRAVVRTDGTVHQGDVRPIIRGRIEPKHIGQLYKRARRAGLLREADYERSNDHEGGNSHRLEPVYRLVGAA